MGGGVGTAPHENKFMHFSLMSAFFVVLSKRFSNVQSSRGVSLLVFGVAFAHCYSTAAEPLTGSIVCCACVPFFSFCLIFCLFACLFVLLAFRLACLIGWLVGSLAGWLACWLACMHVCCLLSFLS